MNWTPRGTLQLASVLAVFAAIALFVSMGLSWWGYSTESAGAATVAQFYPGSQVVEQVSGNGTTYLTYVGLGLLHVGELYSALLAVGIIAGLVTLFAAILGFARAAGSQRFPASRRFHFLTVIVSFALSVALLLLVPLTQPGAYGTDIGSANCGTTPNVCSTVWGTRSMGAISIGWGMDIGWYVALFGVALLAIALVFLILNRRTAPA